MKKRNNWLRCSVIGGVICSLVCVLPVKAQAADKKEETVTLRISNWEEYLDEGDWAKEDAIELESGTIFGEHSILEDFETWYYETYGIRVNVEYSTFGTNEDLYNRLTLGDTYDLVCPSEYMFMKLMKEKKLAPLSDAFFDTSDPNNYYINGVSPYLKKVYEESMVDGESWSKYAAGYMWGVTGMVYNPDEVSREEASTWKILNNPKFRCQVTIKDNVRDSYFSAIGAIKSDLLTSEAFREDPDYHTNLEKEMNDTDPEVIAEVQEYLQAVKENAFSFETDSGKADMITGKVVANLQWSGDGVYTMEQAEEDGYFLEFAIPDEATNIYFDGWVMMKDGIGEDAEKQHAAEAFINFVSRPDNAIRNMNYIGYTSAISGGEDPRILEYVKWNYGADASEKDVTCYNLSYFFAEDGNDGDYTITVPTEQTKRQLLAQYPDQDAISRSSIMECFDDAQYQAINQMWISIRCFDVRKIPAWIWGIAGAAVTLAAGLLIQKKIRRL